MKKRTIIFTLVAAVAAIGATLFIIKKGPELKKELIGKVDQLKEKIKDIEVSDVKDAISTKLTEIKADIQAFDWEKPKAEVEKKFYEFKKQIRAVKKHLPLIQEKEEV